MVDWWRENGPPVYMAAAGYLGLIKERKPSPSAKKAGQENNLNDLLKLAGPGGMIN